VARGRITKVLQVEGSDLPEEVLDAIDDLCVAVKVTPPRQNLNITASTAQSFKASFPEPGLHLTQYPAWPFPHCNECEEEDFRFESPWWQWPKWRQQEVLERLFPQVAARKFKLVSDEFIIASTLSFYNLTGPDWQTDGSSSHVDWSRAIGDGHPGEYGKSDILDDPDSLVQVRALTSIGVHDCAICFPCLMLLWVRFPSTFVSRLADRWHLLAF
jgi:hypothetical protein